MKKIRSVGKAGEDMSRCLLIDLNDPNRPIIPPLYRYSKPITLVIQIPGKTRSRKEV